MLQGGRKFYAYEEKPPEIVKGGLEDDFSDICILIRANLIGSNQTFKGPFGPRKIVYCDYIASGKSLKPIEDFILNEVLPHYGNTHTTTSVTSLQTTLYRHESRDIIRNAVNASEHDAVIFVGHGCTGAVHKLISALDLNRDKRVTVFVSRQEHHSNLLPWRQAGDHVTVVMVQDTPEGLVDIAHLDALLEHHKPTSDLMIGCFCAASNITGLLNDDLAITATLHNHGAMSFWDYATAAPYVGINVNPKVPGDVDNLCAKDAVYFSMHKFVGGVQTPGVLVAKKELFTANSSPLYGGGGGSVFFVTENDHKYLKETELREEAGTPAIVESIRAGLVMKLKNSVKAERILEQESHYLKRAKAKLSDNKSFILLGNAFQDEDNHLPILSFMIRGPDRQNQVFLHHNFVCSLLNDLFGIQARGGCACAGPYAQYLMGLDQDLAKKYEEMLLEDSRLDRTHLRRGHQECSQFEILRPGFSRLNLPWFATTEDIDFILEALDFVASYGWKFLPQYTFNNETGEWKHHTNLVFKERKWLGNFSFKHGEIEQPMANLEEQIPDSFRDVMNRAIELLEKTPKAAAKVHIADQTILFSTNESLRWILLPSEAKSLLCSNALGSVAKSPFQPKMFQKGTKPTKSKGSYDCQLSKYTLTLPSGMKPKASWLDNLEDSKKAVIKKSIVIEEAPIVDACLLTRRLEAMPVMDIQAKWRAPTKDIFKPFLEAIETFQMIKPGDRVLVCLSGGKDSLTLLHTMKQYQYYTKNAFDLGALTVDPLSSAYDPRPLIPYCKALHIDYLYEEQDIMAAAKAANCSSICAYCSRMKRGRMYFAARRDKYNVLALGQHLDDLAESFMMSLFHNGRLRTMKANYTVKEGDLRIIRPFVYVREKQLRTFAETQKLPVIAENCPACFENPKERHRTKQLLAQQELLFPRLYWSLKSAMYPVMNIRATGVESKLFGSKAVNDDESCDEYD